jgi:hypothetical protein
MTCWRRFTAWWIRTGSWCRFGIVFVVGAGLGALLLGIAFCFHDEWLSIRWAYSASPKGGEESRAS